MNNSNLADQKTPQQQLECLYKKYLADTFIKTLNFKVLIAFETWPYTYAVNTKGNIILNDNNKLKEELMLIDNQMKEYANINYSMLNLQF